jgi:hypothetical protein
MKERFYFDDELEKQLKEKSDQFKMYPSDRVWNEVHRALHTRRKRFVAGMGLLTAGILILAGVQLISPSSSGNTARHRAAPASPVAPEAAPALDLSAFNAFSENAGNPDKLANTHGQSGRPAFSPFTAFTVDPADDGQGSGSPVQVSPEIGTVSGRDRTADIMAPAMNSRTASLALEEKEPLKQNLPELADPSDLAQASEKPGSAGRHIIHNDRFSWEIYVSPTLNTRHLDGMDYQQINRAMQNAPITVVRFANVNGFVDNTPALGYDLGGNLLYRLSKSFSLKAGLQFSFSRYFIRAYNANPLQSSAALNSYFGYIADSLNGYIPGRVTNPKNAQHLQNQFYQLSMPVGFEWKLAGKGKLEFHIGATIQPGYLLNRDAYVLSDDYSSYSKEPAELRRWNVNAGAEAFISYRIGKMRVNLGPMVRYQILSTYRDSYPLKENLTNYGLRLGFSKTIR